MFLESLIKEQMSESAIQILQLIISQMNMLLCLVNDLLDIKLIENDRFQPRFIKFSPIQAFEFVVEIFKPHATMQKTSMSIAVVSADCMNACV